MPKLNFKGVVTTCALTLLTVSRVNAQQGEAVERLNIESNAGDTQVLLNAGVIASQGIQSWDTSNVPSISQHMRQSLFAIEGSNNLFVRRKLPSVPRHFFGGVIKGTNYTVDELETAGFTRSEVEEAINNTPFTRNMVKKDLDNACKSNGSAQNCTETFEAAANVVAVLDPNKSSAAIWTGQTAKKVSDEIVKLDGTQEQIKNVIDTSVNVIGFMENQLQPNVSIDGGKETAALNLVKTSMNLMKTKPAIKQEADVIEPPIIDVLKQVSSLGSPSINNSVIGPVIQRYNEHQALARAKSKANYQYSDFGALGGSYGLSQVTDVGVYFELGEIMNRTLQASTQSWEESKAQQAKQNDAPTPVEQVIPQVQVQQPQVVQQQPQQQQQQQNCNPQWQDC